MAKKSTIVAEIEKLEKETSICRKQLTEIESILDNKSTPDNERKKLIKVAEDMRSEMKDKENQLDNLRWENKKTTLAAILVFVFIVLCYLFVIKPLRQKNKEL